MDFKIIWSPTSRFDLKDIVSFIAENNPETAESFGLRIISYAERASRFPKSGRVVPEFDDDTLREFIFYAYRIIYRIKEHVKVIEIVRVWHSARGIPAI